MLALVYDNSEGEADLAYSGGALQDTGLDLETAVLVSLHSDAPAPDGYELADGSPRRGWWADVYDQEDAAPMGSLLWLLEDAVCTEQTAARAREYARAALKWLVDDGHVLSVGATTEVGDEAIMLTPAVTLKSGKTVTFPAVQVT